MNISSLLSRFREQGIKIWLEGDQLKVNAPTGVLTPQLRSELKSMKDEIVQFLQEAEQISSVSTIHIQKAPEGVEIPLSYPQRRLWFLDQYDPENPAYTILKVHELTGPLDARVLERTVQEILRRHSILRTIFKNKTDGEPSQIVLPAAPVEIPWVDLSELPVSEREDRAREFISQQAQIPFELTKGPLFRAQVYQIDADHHWFAIFLHHIVADGWSTVVFFDEFKILYNAFLQGEPSPLPDLPIQYSDYAIWQHESANSAVLNEQLKFWQETLKQPLPLLELPGDRPRPTVQTYHGAYLYERLPFETLQKIRLLCQEYELTPFMVLLAAYQILLYRYTGQEDLIIGTPQANRPYVEIESLIGLFVNTQALRVHLSGNQTGVDLLKQVKQVALDAFSHQDVPFEMIVEKIHPERNTSHSPIFQTFFIVQNLPNSSGEIENVALRSITVDPHTSKYDLTLEIFTNPEGVFFGFEFNTDIFDESTVQRMQGHYLQILNHLLDTPQSPIRTLPILTSSEQQQILVEWNATSVDYPREKTLPVLIEEQAARTPQAIAIQDESGSLSYADLDQASNRLAHYLQSQGVHSGTLVGISLPRSSDLIVALLAILKAGGAYIPLDPNYPVERLKYMIEDSKAPLLITNTAIAVQYQEINTQVICLDTEAETINRENSQPISRTTTPDSFAYVIYTSGSTGKPKGVQVRMQGLVNFLYSMLDTPGLTSQDVLLSVTTLSFDIAGLELYLPLISGARLVLVPTSVAADGSLLIKALEKSQATFMQATPTTWKMLISAGWQGNPRLKALCGGEALPNDLAAQLVPRCASLWNMYGPTETTIWSTLCQITDPAQRITVGRPIANTQVYILDTHGQPVPVGIPGELSIGGDGVAAGYLDRPELTQEKFLPNPFSDLPGARLYRTGDLARYLPDGQIDILGRIDNQVKIHGVRIELGEISAVLTDHPDVQTAVVVGRKEQAENPYLAAYIIPNNGKAPTEDAIRIYLSERLPTAMIPTRYVFMQQFPLTPNGKIDTKALPIPTGQPEVSQNPVQPRNTVEAKLVQIWKKLLRTDRVGLKDDFFQLGGHSLLAVQMFNQIHEIFGVNLPLTSLFRQPTIEYLATLIYDHKGSIPWPSLVEIKPTGSKPPLFCIHGIPGDVLWYGHLIPYMDVDQPLWGLEARGLDGIQTPLESIKEMAALYIQELKTIQPEGPYFICGYSFGGTIAYEIARQIECSGQQVALLAIIDHANPKSGYYEYQFNWNFIKNVFLNIPYRIKDALRLRPDEVASRTRRHLAVFFNTVSGRYQKMDIMDVNVDDLLDQASSLPKHVQQLIKINYKALIEYFPDSYPAIVTLLRARGGPLFVSHDPQMGWEKYAKQVEVKIIPGSHLALFKEPNIRSLAKQLQNCIDHANRNQ